MAVSSGDAHAREIWHRDVPGARWLKADLHIHTIDDIAGGRAKMPSGIRGDAHSPAILPEYARHLLQCAIQRGVQVLGITPHSPRMGDADETSAVWSIVNEWRTGTDSGGTPFRDKIYAVFPGFEPSFHDGKSGLHLLFLFDPEIGRDKFMKVFDMVMGNVSPWSNGSGIKMSDLSASEALERLGVFHESVTTPSCNSHWDYLVLAPHIENEKGLLGALKAQVLEKFPHDGIAGLELGDDRLPKDILEDKEWLRDPMARYNQSFFHGSDAYAVDRIGWRYTWIKMSSPRMEALRQAFIAGQPRIRVGYERGANGTLSEISRAPDGLADGRPWLRSVTVSGGASFFGSGGGGRTRFDLSPDLTCIIGGSMTGKSTFLDGLRVHVGAQLPQDPGILKQVQARGRERFLAGSPEVVLDCQSKDPMAPLREQWPAVFYAQSELQLLTKNTKITEILSQIAASKKDAISKLEEDLYGLDSELIMGARQYREISDRLAEAEQAHKRSRQASEEVAAFADAGIGDLSRASAETHQWQEVAANTSRLENEIAGLADAMTDADMPNVKGYAADILRDADKSGPDLHTRWGRIRDLLRSAKKEAGATNTAIRSIVNAMGTRENDIRVRIDRRLAELGHDGAKISQIQAINARASLYESYRANLEGVQGELARADQSFENRRRERRKLVEQQRIIFDQVMETVLRQFDGRIKVSRINDGDVAPLDAFIKGLGSRGITRWWNDLEDGRPAPEDLLKKVEDKRLKDAGMSDAVAASFLTELTPARRREMAALRCKDIYRLEFRMDDGTYRQVDDLSGGQRVSLLLSLLLETDDERPLVIDQPEDELDNRFLSETLLPALRRLKGRRQVILATHNANIVVNGDADQVIHLEATADRGRVAHSGTIDEPAVRGAIIQTVDGGEEAFRMRKLKYGF